MANNQQPKNTGVYIHPASTLIGDVILGKNCSIWPGVVIRADMNKIELGEAVNIQDNSTLHTDSARGISIGDYSLVGHNTMLHGCTIGRGVLIGIGSIVLDKAEIGDGATIVAGCLIRGGKKIPARSLVLPDKDGIKIIPDKGQPSATVMGCLEYIALAKRIQANIFGPFSEAEESNFKRVAQDIVEQMGI